MKCSAHITTSYTKQWKRQCKFENIKQNLEEGLSIRLGGGGWVSGKGDKKIQNNANKNELEVSNECKGDTEKIKELENELKVN